VTDMSQLRSKRKV